MRVFFGTFVLTMLLIPASGQAGFMDITALTPGGIGIGTFGGTLSGVLVSGAMTAPGAGFTSFNSTLMTGIGGSTIDGTSPQHSYAGIYSPFTPLSDRIGFSAGAGPVSARVRITFSDWIIDPTFHIANLDKSFIDFAPSVPLGLTGLTLNSGNGGFFDGLDTAGLTIFDMDPTTIDSTPISVLPPVAGARSAYGSILLSGSFRSLMFDIITPTGIENASFTLSVSPVPEPSAAFTSGILSIVAVFLHWRRDRGQKARRLFQ